MERFPIAHETKKFDLLNSLPYEAGDIEFVSQSGSVRIAGCVLVEVIINQLLLENLDQLSPRYAYSNELVVLWQNLSGIVSIELPLSDAMLASPGQKQGSVHHAPFGKKSFYDNGASITSFHVVALAVFVSIVADFGRYKGSVWSTSKLLVP